MGKGGLAAQKPSRSDEVLEAQQQWQISEQIKSHFQALAPIRHRKPLRSDNSDDNQEVEDDQFDGIPAEFKKYQQLKSLSTLPFVCEDGEGLQPEFVETDYYKDFNSINGLHHTTGNGFIKLDCNEGSYFRLGYKEEGNGSMERIPVRCNPATNDWLPAAIDDQKTVMPFMSKPVRSG
eukprot:PITA_28171